MFHFVLVLALVLVLGFMFSPHKNAKSEYEYRCAEYEHDLNSPQSIDRLPADTHYACNPPPAV